MTEKTGVSIFWFRRDLRLEDNTALHHALQGESPVLPIFIFDQEILQELPRDDARVNFIYQTLEGINSELRKTGSSVKILKGRPIQVWKELLEDNKIVRVYVNRDYEPYARTRDAEIEELLKERGIAFLSFKDQVIFEGGEVLKNDGMPYHVFTPFKNKWLQSFKETGPGLGESDSRTERTDPLTRNFLASSFEFPSLERLGFKKARIQVRPFDLSCVEAYSQQRDYPAMDGTSHLGPHLRFGTVSIRRIVRELEPSSQVFLSELIWREFFMQILFHYPRVVHENFNPKYNGVQWRNNQQEFERWSRGETGYALVDAGMRELNETGHMHNRVRMITAGFLCKHLLIDWRWGESYFAGKLLDFELSSNNGNWQWSAGTGCDAAPYFRIFNPHEQLKKFDKNLKYVNRWVPELDSSLYPDPMVDHKMARERALMTYKSGMTP